MQQHSVHGQLVLPRGLIFLSALWLVGSLILAMGLRTPIHATAAALEPGIRLVLQCIAIGLVIGWPLLRLSQQATPLPIRQTLLDVLVLATLLQVIVWIPRVFTVWSVSRTAAMDAMLVSWTVLVGAIIAAAVGTDRAMARTAAMTACLAIALAGPAVMWFGSAEWESSRDLIFLGPILGVTSIAERGATQTSIAEWQAIIVIAAAGILCWVGLGVVLGMKGRFEQYRRPHMR